MIPRKDETGNRFGKLVVLKMEWGGASKAIARCDCGNAWKGEAKSLRNGRVTSCGKCLRRDRTGEKFNKLTIQHIEHKNGFSYSTALCECGRSWYGKTGHLVSGNTKSCGCHKLTSRRQKDITGQTFNRLTVMEMTWNPQAYVKCLCLCGQSWEGPAIRILRGTTKSCGCLERERIAQSTPEKKRAVITLSRHKRKARLRNLPNTFRQQDMMFMFQYWSFACCICGEQEGLWHSIVLDHWIPLASPACPGTIVGNMLPLCHPKKGAPKNANHCNLSKRAKDPLLWLTAKLGTHKARRKLKEIATFFAAAQNFANGNSHAA